MLSFQIASTVATSEILQNDEALVDPPSDPSREGLSRVASHCTLSAAQSHWLLLKQVIPITNT
jgi:hypothetical protein